MKNIVFYFQYLFYLSKNIDWLLLFNRTKRFFLKKIIFFLHSTLKLIILMSTKMFQNVPKICIFPDDF